MQAKLKDVDASREPGPFRRAFAAVANTRFLLFLSRNISWKLDPLLLRLTGGRVSTTLMIPTGVLETRGAKTGVQRRNAVIYFRDAERVVVIPSNAGAPNHPAWYHNLLAHPEVSFNGIAMHATVVEDSAEQQRLWAAADRVFPAFAAYRRSAATTARTIPIVLLNRRP